MSQRQNDSIQSIETGRRQKELLCGIDIYSETGINIVHLNSAVAQQLTYAGIDCAHKLQMMYHIFTVFKSGKFAVF